MCLGLLLAIFNVEFILASLNYSFEERACHKPKLNKLFGIVTKLESPLDIKAYPSLSFQIYKLAKMFHDCKYVFFIVIAYM